MRGNLRLVHRPFERFTACGNFYSRRDTHGPHLNAFHAALGHRKLRHIPLVWSSTVRPLPSDWLSSSGLIANHPRSFRLIIHQLRYHPDRPCAVDRVRLCSDVSFLFLTIRPHFSVGLSSRRDRFVVVAQWEHLQISGGLWICICSRNHRCNNYKIQTNTSTNEQTKRNKKRSENIR